MGCKEKRKSCKWNGEEGVLLVRGDDWVDFFLVLWFLGGRDGGSRAKIPGPRRGGAESSHGPINLVGKFSSTFV